jgi:hypothetical protein
VLSSILFVAGECLSVYPRLLLFKKHELANVVPTLVKKKAPEV